MQRVVGRVWIQGAGELASGVAYRLTRCGYQVVMAEMSRPLAVRRRVVFSEAVYEGRAEVEGVTGRLMEPGSAIFAPGIVSVIVDPEASQLSRLLPEAVIDARMTKRAPEPLPRQDAPLIGLGPGFRCGRDADFIIETHREARLGSVLDQGEAAPNTGIPGPVGAETSRRLLRAPAEGWLQAQVRIGDLVTRGQRIGSIAGEPLLSQLDGMVRGLIHPKVELFAGQKVGDIDPRGAAVDPTMVSDKALAVAGGVLEALLRCGIAPGPAP